MYASAAAEGSRASDTLAVETANVSVDGKRN
jgi:hypothetical protein